MAILAPERLSGCDGYRVESPGGLLGWVEETWLGPDEEPAALAVRTIDGRRGLLPARDVELVLESEAVLARDGARLLELDAPRLDGAPPFHASWSTTGATLEPPRPPGLVRRALIARRPWLLAPVPAQVELTVWQMAILLYAGIVVLAALVITAAFVIAHALA